MFTARYPAQCEACPDLIAAGDAAEYIDGGRIVHADCADTEARPRPGQRREHPVCRRCYLVHPPQMECRSW